MKGAFTIPALSRGESLSAAQTAEKKAAAQIGLARFNKKQ
jgi:hypothetical protein